MRDGAASAEQKTVKRAMRGSVEAYGILIRKQKEFFTARRICIREMKMMRWRSSRRLSSGRSGRSENLKDPGMFRTWITRILINVSKDYYKRIQRHAAAAELEIPQETGGISAEERLDLYSAIERLPEKYRTVVILRYFDELKLDEIAYITGVPEGPSRAG